MDNDGCSQMCQIEPGYDCLGGNSTHPDTCSDLCGDGLLIGNRPNSNYCDDGNNDPFDGCDATCQVETGFTCSEGTETSQDICTEICGDGLNLLTHPCDDGNSVDGDGCSHSCNIEYGYQCIIGQDPLHAKKDVCMQICGDAIIIGSRPSSTYCDDGNISDDDGCSGTC